MKLCLSFNSRVNLPSFEFPQSPCRQFHHRESSFVEEVISWLNTTDIAYEHVNLSGTLHQVVGLCRMDSSKFKVGLHIIPAPDDLNPSLPSNTCAILTDDDESPFDTIIHLHEDVWLNKQDIVKARLQAKVGKANDRWYARQTKVVRIDANVASNFLEKHHLWGSTKSKYNYGLVKGEELIAVATFSKKRNVKRGYLFCRPWRSHELIRYCSTKDSHVIGGISKLLTAFCRDLAPDDIITCIDRDWGDGNGWSAFGFNRVDVMPPLVMAIGKDGENNITRYYLVGASLDTDVASKRNSRPDIDVQILNDLNLISDAQEATRVLKNHGLFLVFDAGVERRILITKHTNQFDNVCATRRKELGVDDLNQVQELSVKDLWKTSTPSYPNSYYSPSNIGIEALLRDTFKSRYGIE